LIVTAEGFTLRRVELQKSMELTVSVRSKPTSASMKTAARKLLKGLSEDLAAATAASSVHGARRRIKRLRSLLRLLREAIGEQAYAQANETLKTAADLLAGQRRAEALVVAAGKHAGPSASGRKLVELMERNRDEHAAQASSPTQLAAARDAAASLAKAAAAWKVPRSGGSLIAEGFVKTYRKARKQLATAVKSKDVETLHEARKHVIHHFHHVELLRDAFERKPDERLAELEKLRETLGDLNDIDEMEQLAASQGHPAKGEAATHLARRRKALISAARKAWKPLFRHSPKAFAKRIGAMWGSDA
jgi:CHAD domain-containing protein